MLNRLLYEFYKSPNNSKQIAMGPDGRRLLLVHSEIMVPARLSLKRARTQEPKSLGDFDEDGDVDGSDLATFASEFGRTDCQAVQ